MYPPSIAESISMVIKQTIKTSSNLDKMSRNAKDVVEVSNLWQESYKCPTSLDNSDCD